MMSRVGMLAVDSSRTRAYLSAMSLQGLLPAHVVFLRSGGMSAAARPVPYFDNVTPALERIEALNIPCLIADTADVNSTDVIEAVRASPVDVFVYSGPSGAILRREILSTGKKFLHVHPGALPSFRGSTTVYYSLLVSGTCGASAIFLDEHIDAGPILATRNYPPPADRTLIDHGYDPYIRSDLLMWVLREYQTTGRFSAEPQPPNRGETYYIMHPVLRHIAILSERQEITHGA